MAALSEGFGALSRTAFTAGVPAVALGAALGAAFETLAGSRRKLGAAGRARRARSRSPAVRFLCIAAGSFALGWFAHVAIVYSVQDSLVFRPSGLTESRLERLAAQYPYAEPIEVTAADGAVLRGWLLPPAEDSAGGTPRGKAPLVLVFAGQGGEASRYFSLARMLPEMAWAFVNYRGYGASDGTPSDRALFGDATAAFDALTARPDIDAGNVFAFGGSLGTGVATYLAAHRPLAGVVLFSPYDSIGSGVARDFFRWAPTGLLIRHRFDAAAHAPRALAPVLAVIGEEDTVIRPARSLALLERWGGETRIVTIAGGDHYSIYESDEAWEAVRRFVDERLRRTEGIPYAPSSTTILPIMPNK